MVNTLRVILWDEEIGRLAWDEHRRLSYFTYNPEFLKKGIDVSPLQAPVRGIRAMTPVWGENAKMYQKLPAFLADSLPDAWGNQLFELWRIQNHIPNADITPLDKLSFIGKRGMGVLEFLPEVAKTDKAEKIDVKSLADLAERIFIEREMPISCQRNLSRCSPCLRWEHRLVDANLRLSLPSIKLRGRYEAVRWLGFRIMIITY